MIDMAEDRERFGKLLKELKIPSPEWGSARNYEEAKTTALNSAFP